MGSRQNWGWAAVATLVAVLLGCLVSSCGDDAASGGDAARENSEVTITVTSRGYPEEEVLREIYAQSLEASGFKVRRRELEPGLLAPEELETGRISGYPDHLETALTEASPTEVEDVPASPQAAYRELKGKSKEKGFVPFPPASFVRTNAIGVLRRTAEERDLHSLSDLRGPSREMSVLAGEFFCHGRPCLGDFERGYGIVFEAYSGVDLAPPLYRALRTGETDAVTFINTEGLARGKNWLVLLEDDQHRFPAANAFWLTRQDVVDEAGADYEKAILAAQKGLTVEIMRKLDAKVELEEEPPAKVAAEYLRVDRHRR
jgi:glycine betaine/choline ABC-type transport system substrate-binding protein